MNMSYMLASQKHQVPTSAIVLLVFGGILAGSSFIMTAYAYGRGVHEGLKDRLRLLGPIGIGVGVVLFVIGWLLK